MYRRLANSKSQERLATQTPYKSPRQKIISQQPIPTEYSQVSTQNIPTYSSRSSRRSSSFYDLICRKCYKTREIALNNSFTPHDSKPQKEKLNNSFIQANPYSFQDLMSRDYVKRNKDKINKRQNVSDNALFVAFAPFEDPEIAVAVVIEHGVKGANAAYVAKDIFDEYFTYLYAWQYAMIVVGMLIMSLRITYKQIRKLFGETVKKSLKGGVAE